jgi:MFS family permease
VTSEPTILDVPASAPATTKPTAAAWYALAVLALINVFSNMDRAAIAILLEPIRLDLGLSNQELGLISGMAFVLLYVTCGFPLGWLADRYSRVRILAVSLGAWSIMTALCGMARSFPQLFLARMGVGVGEAGCNPAAHSMIGDLFPRERRAMAIGIYQSGAALGGSVGLYFIGYIGQEYGWRTAMQVAGFLGAPVVLLVLLTLREPKRPATHSVKGERFRTALGALLRRPPFVNIMIAFSLITLASSATSAWVPTLLFRNYGMSLAEIGGWFGAASAVGSMSGLVLGGVFVNWMMRLDTRWECWFPAVGYTICLPLYLVMLLSPQWWMVILFNVIGTFFSAMGASTTFGAIQSFTEPGRRATAIALMGFFSALVGHGGGPYVVGLLTDLLLPLSGGESLRHALVISQLVMIPAIGGYFVAGLLSAKHRVL